MNYQANPNIPARFDHIYKVFRCHFGEEDFDGVRTLEAIITHSLCQLAFEVTDDPVKFFAALRLSVEKQLAAMGESEQFCRNAFYLILDEDYREAKRLLDETYARHEEEG